MWKCLRCSRQVEPADGKCPTCGGILEEVPDGQSLDESGSPQFTLVPTRPPRGILWLLAAHVVVGLIGARAVNLGGPSAPLVNFLFFGVLFGDISLLGTWGALGAHPWRERLIGVIVGVGYLVALWSYALRVPFLFRDTIVIIATVAITLVTLPLLIVRCFGDSIQRSPFPSALVSQSQFPIWLLLALTFVIACLAGIGKMSLPPTFFAFVFSASVIFLLVGVLPVWFVLATKQPVLYSVGLVAVGACGGYGLGRTIHEFSEELWMIGTATEAITVVVSLLVVRSCGYRLVGLPAPSGTGSTSLVELPEAEGERAAPESARPDWKCSACGETVPGNFDMCWNCRSSEAD